MILPKPYEIRLPYKNAAEAGLPAWHSDPATIPQLKLLNFFGKDISKPLARAATMTRARGFTRVSVPCVFPWPPQRSRLHPRWGNLGDDHIQETRQRPVPETLSTGGWTLQLGQ